MKGVDVEVSHCWIPGCFWVMPGTRRSRAWLTSHTPLEPAWLARACLLEPEDWKDGGFMVANVIVMATLAERMMAGGLRVRLLPLPRDRRKWRKQTADIAAKVRAGTLGWSMPEPDPGDERPRNAFGYLLGFGEAYRRYYEEQDRCLTDTE